MADKVQTTTHTEVAAGADEHAVPSALGFDATMLVGLAMAVVIALMLWKRVPAAIAKSLDGRIATIRSQLDEAAQLRAREHFSATAIVPRYEALYRRLVAK